MIKNNIIGKKIKEFRKNSGITQDGFALKLGLSRNYICLVETGKKVPALKTLAHMANILGVTVDSIMCDDPVVAELRRLVEKVGAQKLLEELKFIEEVNNNDK